MTPTQKPRKYQRFIVSQHLDCKVLLNGSDGQLLQLSDISDGGMMVLLTAKDDSDRYLPPQKISGEIVSENTDLRMQFSGNVVWKREFSEGRVMFASMGIQFASDVKLPDAIREMLSSEDD